MYTHSVLHAGMYNKPLQDPIDLRQEADTIYSAFELSLCRDVVFELHRELHTGVLTKERLWAEHNNPPPKSVAGGDVYGRIPPREPSTSITCPSCNRAVGAARYAPHLDKCALGSSRGRASRSARSSALAVGCQPVDDKEHSKTPSCPYWCHTEDWEVVVLRCACSAAGNCWGDDAADHGER
ncbi:conserved unknown protein [Ectocarpus siliculosus]|uniref:SAGA-associated factor 11 n=1 Tax=Ectocarpus siliculosus TaxID=2880 RepID=D7FXW5_ECTSI|nr:conserved unknown protein [Ectocarpus siliculosus]|eukprot:CBJ32378.1 conserved unknown protein [Ectocarpus siliculosus]